MILSKTSLLRYFFTFVLAFSTAFASLKWFQDNTTSSAIPNGNISQNLPTILPSLLSEHKKPYVDVVSSQKFGFVVSPKANVIPLTAQTLSLTNDVAILEKDRAKIVEEDVLKEEAKACIRKAKQFVKQGNRKLATKLFRHALNLAPKYSEVLNEFGEFLEEENVVQADMMYQRAISHDPTHNTALLNRKRTAPVVAEHDQRRFAQIDAKKKELYKYSTHHPNLRAAMKEFYYEHIYHTIALEGNTLSLEEIKHIIDHHTALAGKSIFEHNEVIGMAEALNYMNNTLLMKIGNITVTDIKNIHKRVLGYVDPINAGEFRTNQVYVGKHIPPHPSEMKFYMEQFEEWLNSAEALSLHPVEYAAIAHYKLVYIHPFVDGNGRTSRLLMNFILMKNGFPPVSIEVDDRWEYYECLIAANDGDLRPFIRFIADCTYNTLEVYLAIAELPYLRMEKHEDVKTLPCKDKTVDSENYMCNESEHP